MDFLITDNYIKNIGEEKKLFSYPITRSVFRQQHLKSKFGQGPAVEIQVGDEDVNKVHDLTMQMIPGLTMKDKFQGRDNRTHLLDI